MALSILLLLRLVASFKTDLDLTEGVQFLQVGLNTSAKKRELVPDVVFMHLPYNFGHTVEKVGFAPQVQDVLQQTLAYGEAMAIVENPVMPADEKLAILQSQMPPSARLWGHMHPLLRQTSNTTGCPLYFTPGKYWPRDVAQSYFKEDQIFAMLRDPYERLVAQFRGDMDSYGGDWGWRRHICDVDGAIKQKMEDLLSGKMGPFAEACAFLPQAEFFDAPFGIKLPVDNRYFPDSANEFLKDHGHPDMHIQTAGIFHVEGCNGRWAGNLSCETKALIRQVYARDFELICQHFGHCDVHENTCLTLVPDMCPGNLPPANLTGTYCA